MFGTGSRQLRACPSHGCEHNAQQSNQFRQYQTGPSSMWWGCRAFRVPPTTLPISFRIPECHFSGIEPPPEIQSNPIRTPQVESTTPPLHRIVSKIFFEIMPRSCFDMFPPQPPSTHLRIAEPGGGLLEPDVGKSSGGL